MNDIIMGAPISNDNMEQIKLFNKYLIEAAIYRMDKLQNTYTRSMVKVINGDQIKIEMTPKDDKLNVKYVINGEEYINESYKDIEELKKELSSLEEKIKDTIKPEESENGNSEEDIDIFEPEDEIVEEVVETKELEPTIDQTEEFIKEEVTEDPAEVVQEIIDTPIELAKEEKEGTEEKIKEESVDEKIEESVD